MDLFDFNNDGKVDLDEIWIAHKIMTDCEKDSEDASTKPSPKHIPTVDKSFSHIPSDETPTNTPPSDSPSTPPSDAQVYGGCAIQLLGPILCFATMASLGIGAAIILFACLIGGGLIITGGKLHL